MPTWSGFHRLDPAERLARIADHASLSPEDVAVLTHASALPADVGAAFIENAVGAYPLPLGFAVNFVVDGHDVVVPMAVEESSVVAAASHGARLAKEGGGFQTEAMAPVTIGQVEVRDVPDRAAALSAVVDHRDEWISRLNASIPRMVQRGGGVTSITARNVGEDRVVVHLHVDTRDAMGANVVNSLCEAIGDDVATACGGTRGLRILSNLATERLVTARCTVPADGLGGPDVAAGIVAADEWARLDPYRAATHNKGIMNGIDPVVIATGNDWRAVESGAHAFAAHDGQYRGLTTWTRNRQGDLEGELTLPLAVGVVGGVTRLHPTAAACLQVLGGPDATGLARIMASVGLAQNLAALRALAAEGIQAGHMALHAANQALQGGQHDQRTQK